MGLADYYLAIKVIMIIIMKSFTKILKYNLFIIQQKFKLCALALSSATAVANTKIRNRFDTLSKDDQEKLSEIDVKQK